MYENVSVSTAKNWERLRTDPKEKLTQRANKTNSKKKFVPIEYFRNPDNIFAVQKIIDQIASIEITNQEFLFSLGIFLLKQKGLFGKKHVDETLSKYNYDYFDEIENFNWPTDETDLLGITYQSLLYEGEKNNKGSYYTPKSIVDNMTFDLDMSSKQTFLDPCCGSGAFLISLKKAAPDQLFGMDSDPIAVMIAKINLLLCYPSYEFIPNIECGDFLSDFSSYTHDSGIFTKNFDYIITNPPWGASNLVETNISEIISNESFSLFFVRSYYLLKAGGKIRFLFPESVLNVKTHKDLRSFILQKCHFISCTMYDDSFTGVTTKYIDILCSKSRLQHSVLLLKNGIEKKIDTESFYLTDNLVFNFLSDKDIEIIEKVKTIGRYTLEDSIWALGIVTGNNKEKIRFSPQDGFEEIITGKEILPYHLDKAKKYLRYDRSQLQQVAKDEYYRAPEKLVYKFISNRLVFAYDNKQKLVLNSANILIPRIPNMSIKTVMAFLNSELYQYLYVQLFGEVKVLKGNLAELPFPLITEKQDTLISDYTERYMCGEDVYRKLQDCIFDIFQLDNNDILQVRSALNGIANRIA